MPSGRGYSWGDIRRRYREQIEGQGYDPKRIRADLKKKRQSFETLAKVSWLSKKGYTATGIARILECNEGVVGNWLKGRAEPALISKRRHEYHQRSRQEVRFDPTKIRQLGYLIGSRASGRLKITRNKMTGQSSFIARVSSRGVVNELHDVTKQVIGLAASVAPPTGSRRHFVIRLTSANLANTLGLRELYKPSQIPDVLPNHPEARLGFTRALFDGPRIRVKNKPHDKEVRLVHENPRVLDLISRTLHERGVGHTRSERKGEKGINITTRNLPAFKAMIGFRDGVRHNKLPG